MQVHEVVSREKEEGAIVAGDEIKYTVTVSNVNTESGKISIEKILPEGLTYKSSSINISNPTAGEKSQKAGTYDEGARKIYVEAYGMDKESTVKLAVTATVDKLKDGEYSKDITTESKIVINDRETLKTSPVTITVKKPILKLTAVCSSDNKYLNEGEKVEYKLVIENIGDVDASNLIVKQYIPEGLDFISASNVVNFYGENMDVNLRMDDSRYVYGIAHIAAGSKYELTVKAEVLAVHEDKNISSTIDVTGDTIDNLTASIDNVIEKSPNAVIPQEGDDDDPENNNGGGNRKRKWR